MTMSPSLRLLVASFSFALLFVLFSAIANPVQASTWGPYRGMTTQLDISEHDVADFAKLGGNLLRVGFAKQPLMRPTPPYDFDEDAFAKLDSILGWCKRYGVKVVIDPHTTPGTERRTTILPSDDLWRDMQYHELLERLWERIAKQYHNRNDVIAGYDLLNEPAAKVLPFPSGAADYNSLVRKLAGTIRKYDATTPIIIEPPIGKTNFGNRINRLEGLTYLTPLQIPNIIYSPHMYEPGAFTHQGIDNRKSNLQYPGQIGMQYWNKEKLRQILAPALEWQRSSHATIYIGEFSASNYSGDSGNRYLRDLIELFEEYGWSWTYHAWRQAPIWDAESSGTRDGFDQRAATTSARLDIIRSAFKRNKANP